jgi:hypothetical protein
LRDGDFRGCIKVKGGRASGDPKTTFGNTMATIVLMELAIRLSGNKAKVTCSGDDSLIFARNKDEAMEILDQLKKWTVLRADDKKPCSGFIIPQSDINHSDIQNEFCSKVITITTGKVCVTPKIDNFIFNSRSYTGHSRIMISNPKEHRLAVAQSKHYASKNAFFLSLVAEVWSLGTEETTLHFKLGEWIKKFGDFWLRIAEESQELVSHYDRAVILQCQRLGWDYHQTCIANATNYDHGLNRLDVILSR